MPGYDLQLLADQIDGLLRLKARVVECEINASACRTQRDWKRAHDAQDAFDNLYGAVMDVLRANPTR